MNLNDLFMNKLLPIQYFSQRWGKEHETFILLCPHCGTPITTVAYNFNSRTRETLRIKMEDMAEYSVTCEGCEKLVSANQVIFEELN